MIYMVRCPGIAATSTPFVLCTHRPQLHLLCLAARQCDSRLCVLGSLASRSTCRMQPPVRLLVGAGCLVAAVAANKLRQGKRTSKSRSQQRHEGVVEKSSELVHAYCPSPSVSIAQQIPPAAGTVGHGGAVGLLVMYTVLICSGATAAALREQWDLVAAFAVAWLLVILGQVLYGPQRSSWSAAGRAVSEVEAAPVDVVSPEPSKVQDLAGTWIKDGAACESLDAAMDMLHCNGLVRTGGESSAGFTHWV
eukprot:GHUV01017862.1.p1 GENE.GHUV01017862.1~~GHUV01017862.1.p1  ORF type:complete len:250 (+),score=40.49 GHUV01017862.1:3-752(+)